MKSLDRSENLARILKDLEAGKLYIGETGLPDHAVTKLVNRCNSINQYLDKCIKEVREELQLVK